MKTDENFQPDRIVPHQRDRAGVVLRSRRGRVEIYGLACVLEPGQAGCRAVIPVLSARRSLP